MLEAMFSFRGRINRLQYFLRGLALGVVCLVLVIVAVVMIIGHGGVEAAEHPDVRALAPIGLLMLLAAPLFVWASFSLQARRFRDIGWNPILVIPPWIALSVVDRLIAMAAPSLSLGPAHSGTIVGVLINLILGCCLLFWPGRPDDGSEPAMDVGAPPPSPRSPPMFISPDRGVAATPKPAPVQRAATPQTSIPSARPAGAGFGRRGL